MFVYHVQALGSIPSSQKINKKINIIGYESRSTIKIEKLKQKDSKFKANQQGPPIMTLHQ